MLRSRNTKPTEPVDKTDNSELWIGEVECCGAEWTFALFGTGTEPIESYVYASLEATERARAAMFTVLGRRAVAVTVERADKG
jgi:hypothetical protein